MLNVAQVSPGLCHSVAPQRAASFRPDAAQNTEKHPVIHFCSRGALSEGLLVFTSLNFIASAFQFEKKMFRVPGEIFWRRLYFSAKKFFGMCTLGSEGKGLLPKAEGRDLHVWSCAKPNALCNPPSLDGPS